MHVKRIKIDGFRGIRSLEWAVNGAMIGLVGPGDSTKTTILDAIEYALSPRWSLPISDGDFHGGTPASAIRIEVTVGDVPVELLKEEKFGLYVRGWGPNGGIIDEPDDDCEPVLTIRFEVTTDLETSWMVVTDRHPEGKVIAWRDRARLGVVRLGAEVDRDLAWGRGSALSRLTGAAGTEGVLAAAYRAARDAVAKEELAGLVEAAATAATHARRLGATPSGTFKPALDAAAMSVNLGALSLHDGAVPVRAAGLGTRRLVSLAIQQAIVPDGAIVLVDEIEHALEPHRIRHLVRQLRQATAGSEGQATNNRHGQVILTTHSPVAAVEFKVHEVRVVRSQKGETRVLTPDPDLQGVLRSAPEALLGRRLVVCEGPTEVGLCWGLEGSWQQSHSGESTASRGVVFVNGGGSGAPKRAMSFAGLGYTVAYFADSDREVSPSAAELVQAGACVILWDGALSSEQRIFSDLPWKLVQEAFDLAIEEFGAESVIAAAAHQLGLPVSALTGVLDSWKSNGIQEQDIRSALGRAAKGADKRPAWYKRYDRAENLAGIVLKALPEITNTDLGSKLRSLETWCYAG